MQSEYLGQEYLGRFLQDQVSKKFYTMEMQNCMEDTTQANEEGIRNAYIQLHNVNFITNVLCITFVYYSQSRDFTSLSKRSI